ncbi:MAG: hypothetical protein AAB275_01430 [Deltaproteobacteria bacterium]
MKTKGYLSALFLSLTLFLVYAPETSGADNEPEEGEVIERTIEIKGTLEKPRVIFIIPKARLQKEKRSVKDQPKKSFISDILKPVYPESLIKEEGIDNLSRR